MDVNAVDTHCHTIQHITIVISHNKSVQGFPSPGRCCVGILTDNFTTGRVFVTSDHPNMDEYIEVVNNK